MPEAEIVFYLLLIITRHEVLKTQVVQFKMIQDITLRLNGASYHTERASYGKLI